MQRLRAVAMKVDDRLASQLKGLGCERKRKEGGEKERSGGARLEFWLQESLLGSDTTREVLG